MFNYNNNRIVAIGDIHGDYDIFVSLLIMAKVINCNLDWIGKNTYVIQLGDTLDGKRPGIIIEKKFLDIPTEIDINCLILSLDRKARKHGGRVISLLGNHELYPYYFYNDESFNKDYVKSSDIQEYKDLYKTSRFRYYKPGVGDGAKLYGKTRPLIIQLGKFIFSHGSISTKFLDKCLKHGYKKSQNPKIIDLYKVNKAMSDWMIGNTKKPPFFVEDDDTINPLFNRDLTNPRTLNEKQCKEIVDPIFKYLQDANYLVMGHSLHKNINTLCNDHVYRTDIGISRAFGKSYQENMKRLQVLEIKQYKTAIKTNIITPEGKIKII